MQNIIDEFKDFTNDEFMEFFNSLDEQKAKYYGFRRWSSSSNLFCIPITLEDFIPIGIELTSINGNKIIYNGSNIDLDTKFGLLSYGICIGDNPKFYDGAIINVEDIYDNFILDKRNDYLKCSYYISKDKKYLATIYDGIETAQIERNE